MADVLTRKELVAEFMRSWLTSGPVPLTNDHPILVTDAALRAEVERLRADAANAAEIAGKAIGCGADCRTPKAMVAVVASLAQFAASQEADVARLREGLDAIRVRLQEHLPGEAMRAVVRLQDGKQWDGSKS